MKMKILFKKITLFLCLYILTINFANAGSLQLMFVNSIDGLTNGWIAPLIKIGTGIGVSFWLIESLIEIKNKQLYDNGQALLMFALKRSIIFAVLTAIFIKFDLYKTITTIFLSPAQSLTGLGGAGSSFGLDPGDVWQHFADWYKNDYAKIMDELDITNVGGQIGLIIYSIIYMISCVLISFEIIMLNVKFKVILFAGVIFAGCWGSGWTREYWYKYVSALVGISFQVLVFCLIYAAYKASLNYNSLKTMSDNGLFSDDFLLQIIGTIIACLSLRVVPGWVSGIFTGVSGGVGGGDVMSMMSGGIKNAANVALGKSSGGGASGGNKPSSGQNGNNSASKQAPMNSGDKAAFMGK